LKHKSSSANSKRKQEEETKEDTSELTPESMKSEKLDVYATLKELQTKTTIRPKTPLVLSSGLFVPVLSKPTKKY
jgi:hypothetical protein